MRTSLVFTDPADARHWASLGFADYADFAGWDGGAVVARSASSCTRSLTIREGNREAAFFIKRYNYQGRRRRLAFQRDKAATEAANYAYLCDVCHVDVPDVICHGSRRSIWRHHDSFILTRGVPDALPADAFAAMEWPVPADAARDPRRGALIARSAGLVRRMHDAAFYHVDLQWRNMLVSSAPGESERIYIIDSSRGGVRRSPLMRAHGRLRDLSSLAKEAMIRLTRSERLRWLHCYLATTRFCDADRDLIHAIERDRVLKDNSRRT